MQNPSCDARRLKTGHIDSPSREMDLSWNILHYDSEWSHPCRAPSLGAPGTNVWHSLPTSMREIMITRGVLLTTSQCQIQIHTFDTCLVPFQASWTRQFWCKELDRSFDLCTLGGTEGHSQTTGFEENHPLGTGDNFLQKCPIHWPRKLVDQVLERSRNKES